MEGVINVPNLVGNNFVTRIKSYQTMQRMKSATTSGRASTALKFKNTATDSKLIKNIDSVGISGATTNAPEETRQLIIEQSNVYSQVKDGKMISI